MKRKGYIIGGVLAAVVIIVVGIFIRNNRVCTVSDNKISAIQVGDIGSGNDETQNYWHGSNFTKGNGGYYYWSEAGEEPGMYLMFFDANQKASIPVCGKADCLHNDSTCNAYFSTDYLYGILYYYQDNLYMVKRTNGMAVLERVSSDGSSREDGAQLFPNAGKNTIELTFHDGYVYASDFEAHSGSSEEATSVLKKISLDGKSSEDAFECTGVGTDIGKARSFGDKLFFSVGGAQLDKTTLNMTMSSHLYVYDYNTGTTESVSDQQIYDYYIDTDTNTMYYFVLGEGLYKCTLGETEQTLIRKADDKLVTGSLSYDGKYLYVNNGGNGSITNAGVKADKCIYVLDTDGNEVNEITLDKSFGTVYFGDSQYLFASRGKDNVYLDKSTITSNTEWKTLNITADMTGK